LRTSLTHPIVKVVVDVTPFYKAYLDEHEVEDDLGEQEDDGREESWEGLFLEDEDDLESDVEMEQDL
jgi:hypothetical protein